MTTTDQERAEPPAGIDVVIVSGLSGAGRSTAAKCLEDLGYFVVDNLPPELIETMADLGSRSRGAVTRIAIVLDVRSRAFFADLREVIHHLDERGFRPRIVFLEASEDALVRRFEGVRRQHPLQAGRRLVDGIAEERELMRDLAGEADLTIDTSDLNVHELRRKIEDAFEGAEPPQLRATVLSFGYKYGLPMDADLVADVRFLANPYWILGLRDLTGQDPEVRTYVLAQPGATEFLDQYHALLQLVSAGFRREGKRYLTLAVGCTGGKHRSVTIAEQLAARLRGDGIQVSLVHRDLGRE